jgi:hypothetical protein
MSAACSGCLPISNDQPSRIRRCSLLERPSSASVETRCPTEGRPGPNGMLAISTQPRAERSHLLDATSFLATNSSIRLLLAGRRTAPILADSDHGRSEVGGAAAPLGNPPQPRCRSQRCAETERSHLLDATPYPQRNSRFHLGRTARVRTASRASVPGRRVRRLPDAGASTSRSHRPARNEANAARGARAGTIGSQRPGSTPVRPAASAPPGAIPETNRARSAQPMIQQGKLPNQQGARLAHCTLTGRGLSGFQGLPFTDRRVDAGCASGFWPPLRSERPGPLSPLSGRGLG